jgi:hypothetical protein
MAEHPIKTCFEPRQSIPLWMPKTHQSPEIAGAFPGRNAGDMPEMFIGAAEQTQSVWRMTENKAKVCFAQEAFP